jgi:hypothetical protein
VIVPDHADWIVTAYLRGQVRIQSWHVGDASMELEVDCHTNLLRQGLRDTIVVTHRFDGSRSFKVTPAGRELLR